MNRIFKTVVVLLLLSLTVTKSYAQNPRDISSAAVPFQFIGKYLSHTRNNNIIDFKCENGRVKLEVCTDDIMRIRMSNDGNFARDEHFVVVQYNWPSVGYTVEENRNWIAIKTNRLLVKVFKTPLRFEFYDHTGQLINKDWEKGSMGFRGNEVICKKELTPSDHFFGLGQRYEKSDLRGTKTTCLVTREYTPVPFFIGTNGYGIFFHNTWASEFDFTQNPYTFYAPGGELDYYFIYGPDFKHIIKQYSSITGFSPLPPKWAFGLFWSRWDEEVSSWKYRQEGQQGLLRTIKAAREVWDWPLDGIRVHSMGPHQNFYASPNTNWPEMLWGEFPAVDEMVKELHGQNIHPLFWEAPGITRGCEMYEEGIKNNYFLLKDGKPTDITFGYLQPTGSVVDFLNPEAREWWGKYHKYMVDFGSDGVAGDWHDEKLIRNTVSPSTGMSSDEFLNIYSLLFNQASWDAYKKYNPDKRSINYGLTYWAGGQRYPMQGTQDSHHTGKNIHGEMMGCINLGLSGIPFRIYTDNVSRSLQPDLPLSRLSQYLSLTVGGERTLIAVTGNEMADWNYRFYGKLRYRLMPYIYTYAREATQTGVPLVRAMVIENQNDPMAFDAYGQFLLGKEILIAPLWSDTTFYRNIYLPEGDWIDFFEGTIYKGKQTINYHAPIDRVPILIKAGAIIPMAPDNQRFIDEDKSSLTIHIYPNGEGTFDLYEDDGVSYGYEKGIFAITRFSYKETPKKLIVSKSKPDGAYPIPDREHIFCIHKKMDVQTVTHNDKRLKNCHNLGELLLDVEGWFYDQNESKFWVKVKNDASEVFNIEFLNN